MRTFHLYFEKEKNLRQKLQVIRVEIYLQCR